MNFSSGVWPKCDMEQGITYLSKLEEQWCL